MQGLQGSHTVEVGKKSQQPHLPLQVTVQTCFTVCPQNIFIPRCQRKHPDIVTDNVKAVWAADTVLMSEHEFTNTNINTP